MRNRNLIIALAGTLIVLGLASGARADNFRRGWYRPVYTNTYYYAPYVYVQPALVAPPVIVVQQATAVQPVLPISPATTVYYNYGNVGPSMYWGPREVVAPFSIRRPPYAYRGW